ncbi:MAG: hypothetical protein JXB30_05475 [Anaerolineae bacterium]|nr:hypothetical protein [Anaerolineae bacterium]
MHDGSVRLTTVVLVFVALIGCTPSDITSTADVEQPQVAPSTSESAPTGTFTPNADATRTPRPTQTPTMVPSATPTLDRARLPAMRIGFVRSESAMWMGEADIWVINADGSDERLVVHYRPYSLVGAEFAFSPDGCWLAVSDAKQGLVFDVRTGEKIVIDEADPNKYEGVSNFAWSPDSTTLTYYRGTPPDMADAIPELRQTRRLTDGSWSEPEIFPLDPSDRVMLPVWELADGRILSQTYGPGGGSGVLYITDLATGISETLTFEGFDDHALYVSDTTLDGRIVFREQHWIAADFDANSYVGRISAGGAISDVVTLAPPPGGSIVYPGKFTPDGTGVLAITQHGRHGGPHEYGLFSLLDNGTTSYTSLLAPPLSIAGHSPLESGFAVVSVTSDSTTETGEIWVVALDGSGVATITEGFWPVGLPICEE